MFNNCASFIQGDERMILKLISNYVESFIDYWNETHSDKMSVGYSRTFNDKWRCKVVIGNQSYTSNPISQFDIPSFIDRTAETYVNWKSFYFRE